MPGYLNTLFLGSTGVSLHWERVGDIRPSAELRLVDEGTFPLLGAVSPTTVDREEEPGMDYAFNDWSCTFSIAGKAAGVKLNAYAAMHVGTAEVEGNELPVWASFISGPGNKFACDAPHRAHIVLEAIHDRRDDAEHGDVRICGINSLKEIDVWSTALPTGSPKVKMAFVYDVLLAEAEGHIG